MLKALEDLHTQITGWIFETLLQPILYATDSMHIADEMLEWVDFALFSLFGILVTYALCRPLEALRPVEPVTDKQAVRTDIFYTLLARLGIFRFWLLSFWLRFNRSWKVCLLKPGSFHQRLKLFFPLCVMPHSSLFSFMLSFWTLANIGVIGSNIVLVGGGLCTPFIMRSVR